MLWPDNLQKVHLSPIIPVSQLLNLTLKYSPIVYRTEHFFIPFLLELPGLQVTTDISVPCTWYGINCRWGL